MSPPAPLLCRPSSCTRCCSAPSRTGYTWAYGSRAGHGSPRRRGRGCTFSPAARRRKRTTTATPAGATLHSPPDRTRSKVYRSDEGQTIRQRSSLRARRRSGHAKRRRRRGERPPPWRADATLKRRRTPAATGSWRASQTAGRRRRSARRLPSHGLRRREQRGLAKMRNGRQRRPRPVAAWSRPLSLKSEQQM